MSVSAEQAGFLFLCSDKQSSMFERQVVRGDQ